MKESNLTNHLLVAMPNQHGETFDKSVVYIYEHTEDGAFGVIINKPMQINLGSVLKHLNIEPAETILDEAPVFMGGPVDQGQGFIIHDTLPSDADTDVVISASKDALRDIAEGIGPKNFLITLGYAGWEPEQLTDEIAQNAWLVVPFDQHILFEVPHEERWVRAPEKLGIDIYRISEQTGHA